LNQIACNLWSLTILSTPQQPWIASNLAADSNTFARMADFLSLSANRRRFFFSGRSDAQLHRVANGLTRCERTSHAEASAPDLIA